MATTRFTISVQGVLPMHEGEFSIRTQPTLLNKREFPKARNQLHEAMAAMHRVRPADASITIYRDEEPLRTTPLIDAPEGDGYLVAEVKPGGKAGTVDEWIVNCALAFSPRGARAV